MPPWYALPPLCIMRSFESKWIGLGLVALSFLPLFVLPFLRHRLMRSGPTACLWAINCGVLALNFVYSGHIAAELLEGFAVIQGRFCTATHFFCGLVVPFIFHIVERRKIRPSDRTSGA